jgi:hypothetical protein
MGFHPSPEKKKKIFTTAFENIIIIIKKQIKEVQIKTTLRFHLTPVRIAIISNTTNNRCC